MAEERRMNAGTERLVERSGPEPGPTVYAREGEWVVCSGPDRHPICRVARDLMYGEAYQPGDLEAWTQPEPPAGASSRGHACRMCGAVWFRPIPTNPFALHFQEGGWR